jgi:hypothetical protein
MAPDNTACVGSTASYLHVDGSPPPLRRRWSWARLRLRTVNAFQSAGRLRRMRTDSEENLLSADPVIEVVTPRSEGKWHAAIERIMHEIRVIHAFSDGVIRRLTTPPMSPANSATGRSSSVSHGNISSPSMLASPPLQMLSGRRSRLAATPLVAPSPRRSSPHPPGPHMFSRLNSATSPTPTPSPGADALVFVLPNCPDAEASSTEVSPHPSPRALRRPEGQCGQRGPTRPSAVRGRGLWQRALTAVTFQIRVIHAFRDALLRHVVGTPSLSPPSRSHRMWQRAFRRVCFQLRVARAFARGVDRKLGSL